MYLSIFSRQRCIFSGEVRSVNLPGVVAPFQVLRGHADIVSVLGRGKVSYEAVGGEVCDVPIVKGLVKVGDGAVMVLVEVLAFGKVMGECG